MKLQELFNKAYIGLASQGFARSVQELPNTICMYRGPHNRKCAIGWAMPDELYDPQMDEGGIVLSEIIETIGVDVDEETVRELQAVHDRAENADEMKDNLAEFATRHALEIPVVQ